jgi:hypothetical protein
MSDLTALEKRTLEKFLGMSSGYVLDFSNRTFEDFILDSTGRDIWSEKYRYASGSKANCLRAFWAKEPNHIVGKLLADLLEYSKPKTEDLSLWDDCRRISVRLREDAPVADIEAFAPNADGRDFESLARAVRDAIEYNQPEAGLDRLHTFVVKYVRALCAKHGLEVDRSEPLHSVFGKYVKHMRENGRIESEMAERILKSAISILEAFNYIRNERSLAHDNRMLGYDESLLIFNNVASCIRFLTAIDTGPSEIA